MKTDNNQVSIANPPSPGTLTLPQDTKPPAAVQTREIHAAAEDELIVAALKKPSANPAAELESPPTSSADDIAAASSAMTSIDPVESEMSITALILLLNQLMLQSGINSQKAFRELRNGQLSLAAKLRDGEVKAMLANKEVKQNKAWTNFAFGCTEGVMSGIAAGSGTPAGKTAWTGGAGMVKASGGLVTTEFDKKEIDNDALAKELSNLALLAQQVADMTGSDGMQTAANQIRAAIENISKSEEEQHRSVEKIAGS